MSRRDYDPRMSSQPPPPPWTPQDPGWYADPWTKDRRWFDGQRWTDQVQGATRKRRGVLAPLLVLAGIAAALYFTITHPTVSVPLAGTQDCGASSFTLGTSSLSDFTTTNSGSTSDLTNALDQECINKGRTNLYYGGGALLVGLIAGGISRRAENAR
jgi:Protein of unknown function (DUF2510)